MDSLKFSLEGLQPVLDKMEGLPKAFKQKGVRFAMRKAANLVRDEAKKNALAIDDPSSKDKIADNIAVRFSTRTFKRTGDVMFRVGVMGTANPQNAAKSEGLPGGATQHWRFKEFGTEDMPPDPFMRPALSNNVDAATNEFSKHLNKWTDRNLKKIKKNGI